MASAGTVQTCQKQPRYNCQRHFKDMAVSYMHYECCVRQKLGGNILSCFSNIHSPTNQRRGCAAHNWRQSKHGAVGVVGFRVQHNKSSASIPLRITRNMHWCNYRKLRPGSSPMLVWMASWRSDGNGREFSTYYGACVRRLHIRAG
jgi:hypothetical protein